MNEIFDLQVFNDGRPPLLPSHSKGLHKVLTKETTIFALVMLTSWNQKWVQISRWFISGNRTVTRKNGEGGGLVTNSQSISRGVSFHKKRRELLPTKPLFKQLEDKDFVYTWKRIYASRFSAWQARNWASWLLSYMTYPGRDKPVWLWRSRLYSLYLFIG